MSLFSLYYLLGDKMLKIKMFDEEHEEDLEIVVNEFLMDKKYQNIIDIKYAIASMISKDNEQIYCYSAMVIYNDIDS